MRSGSKRKKFVMNYLFPVKVFQTVWLFNSERDIFYAQAQLFNLFSRNVDSIKKSEWKVILILAEHFWLQELAEIVAWTSSSEAFLEQV